MSASGELRIQALTGTVIDGKYRLESCLGEGPIGVVFRAQTIATDLPVAVKLLNRDLQTHLPFVSRFHAEAKAAAEIEHPNATRILDVGTDEKTGHLYICMDLVDGAPLSTMLGPGRHLASTRIVDLLMQSLAALGAAHKLGIFHRDLRAENLVVQKRLDDDGQRREVVKVCDFGIARVRTVDLAPPDAPSDLYAVGMVLYQMLTGRLPFEGSTVDDALEQYVQDAPPAPSTITENVDPELQRICLRALSKDPRDRFRTTREMRAALRGTEAFRRLLEGETPEEIEAVPDAALLDVPTPSVPVMLPQMAHPSNAPASVSPDVTEVKLEWVVPPPSPAQLRHSTTEVSKHRQREKMARSRRAFLVPLAGGMMLGALLTALVMRSASFGGATSITTTTSGTTETVTGRH